jgi:hypothetical protein
LLEPFKTIVIGEERRNELAKGRGDMRMQREEGRQTGRSTGKEHSPDTYTS